MELLAWGDAVMEPHLFRVAPGAGSGDSYAHEGEEFLYILKGNLEIALEGGEPTHFARRRQLLFRQQHEPSLDQSRQTRSLRAVGQHAADILNEGVALMKDQTFGRPLETSSPLSVASSASRCLLG